MDSEVKGRDVLGGTELFLSCYLDEFNIEIINVFALRLL
jgi:hypothetical protein